MNLTFTQKKCTLFLTWLLIGILSFTVIGKYAAAPESHQATITSLDEKKNTVMELTMATTATSAVITLLPGDIGTPIAEKVADLSGYLLIVLCAIFLEKYLVTITGYADLWNLHFPCGSCKCKSIRSDRAYLPGPD